MGKILPGKETIGLIKRAAEKTQLVKLLESDNFIRLRFRFVVYACIMGMAGIFYLINEFYLKLPGIPDFEEMAFIQKPLISAVGENEAQVHFIDVNQGDCALILTPDSAVLIDGGENSECGKVYNYLHTLGITRLDCIIGSHPHSDHIGSLYTLLDYIPADNILLPLITSEEPQYASYVYLLQKAEQYNIPVTRVKAGDNFSFGGCDISIIAPVRYDYKELNDCSIVCNVTVAGKKFLFTGDISDDVQKEILAADAELDCDVIKVPHHGSKYSVNDFFIKYSSPSFAVFCASADNRFRHPHDTTYDRYFEAGCTRLRTDWSGTIIFSASPESFRYYTEVDLTRGND